MAKPEFEVPQEWLDELAELKQRVAGYPEDEEDRLIREGSVRFAEMTPDERAKITSMDDEILKRMQTSKNREALDRFFRDTF